LVRSTMSSCLLGTVPLVLFSLVLLLYIFANTNRQLINTQILRILGVKLIVSGFIKTKEGIEEYSKLGLPYPEELFDTDYDRWVADTNASELPKYSKHLPVEVVRITRLKTGENKEYITYCATEYRLDKALNVRHRFRSTFGEYPVPIPIYSIEQGDFGVQNRKVQEIQSVDKAYSIPYSPEEMDKIKALGCR
jgi:hypothetical protein